MHRDQRCRAGHCAFHPERQDQQHERLRNEPYDRRVGNRQRAPVHHAQGGGDVAHLIRENPQAHDARCQLRQPGRLRARAHHHAEQPVAERRERDSFDHEQRHQGNGEVEARNPPERALVGDVGHCRLDFDGNDAAARGIERERDAESGQRDGGVAQPGEKRVNQRMRKLMQLGRNDERQEEEDRHTDGQGAAGLYGELPDRMLAS